MKCNKLSSLFLLAMTLASICSCKKVVKPESAEKREAWLETLNDSINIYQHKMDSLTDVLKEDNERLGEMLAKFEHVNNSREVTGYYILKSWKSRYPLTSTGIVARLNEDEKLEVIAALSGGSFTGIRLESGGNVFSSERVPHDQAFNYKSGSLNTVCFSGNQADSIAQFIARNCNNDIKLTFLENNATGNIKSPGDEKNMISETWNLYNTRKESKENEKLISLYAGKIAGCNKVLRNNEESSEKTE